MSPFYTLEMSQRSSDVPILVNFSIYIFPWYLHWTGLYHLKYMFLHWVQYVSYLRNFWKIAIVWIFWCFFRVITMEVWKPAGWKTAKFNKTSTRQSWRVVFFLYSIHNQLACLLSQCSGGSRLSQTGEGAPPPEYGAKIYYLARFLSKCAWK